MLDPDGTHEVDRIARIIAEVIDGQNKATKREYDAYRARVASARELVEARTAARKRRRQLLRTRGGMVKLHDLRTVPDWMLDGTWREDWAYQWAHAEVNWPAGATAKLRKHPMALHAIATCADAGDGP